MKSYNNKVVLFIVISVVAIMAIFIYIHNDVTTTDNISRKSISRDEDRRLEDGKTMIISYENEPYKSRSLASVAIRSKDVISDLGTPEEEKFYNGYKYFVYSLSDQGKRFVVFSNESNVLHDIYNTSKLLNKIDFVDIKEGSSYENVQAIDKYAYLHRIGNERAISEHKLDSGKSIIIDYKLADNIWVVVKKAMDEESSVTGKLIIDYFENSNN